MKTYIYFKLDCKRFNRFIINSKNYDALNAMIDVKYNSHELNRYYLCIFICNRI